MKSNGAMRNMHSLTAKTRLLGLTALLAGVLATVPAAANAQSFGIGSFSTSSSTSQAGAHADLSTSFAVNTDANGNPVDQLKDVQVNLPSGVVGNPQAVPKCSDKDFQAFNCPVDSQVGVLNASFITSPGQSTQLSQATVAPTTLTADLAPCTFMSNSCEQNIGLAGTTGINSGDYLTIGTGATAEHVTVTSVDHTANTVDGSVTGNGLQFSHASGDPVFDDTIAVASTTGFEGFDGGNQITIGTGATQETDTIAFAPGDIGHLDLNDPLAFHHAPGENVVHMASTAAAPIPVFNLVPDPGHVATLAGSLLIATIPIQIDVRKDGSYGLTATISDISTLLPLVSTDLTLWGVPGDPSHAAQRCGQLGNQCNPTNSVPETPFMTNPTNCSGAALTTTLSVDSYQNQGQFVTQSATQSAPTGCGQLAFSPSLTVTPDTSQADTPAGYDVDLSVPQNQDASGLATPDVQNVSVTLPAGTALSPAVANGLQGCADAQFAANTCPEASKVGTVSIATPLLPDNLTGAVWIGAPIPGQMYRLFATASADNVTINLSGQINPNPSTGQLTAVFNQNPQLPFNDLNLKFFSGPLAPLANPETCGTATTTSDIAPYGSPATGADAAPSSSFTVTGCNTPASFAPTFSAGTTNPVAGAFSSFTLTFGRQDTDQELSSLSATLPPGLFAKIAGVPQCPSANAAAGTCSAASQVGTATVGSGAGAHPIFLGGQVYLTGPYNGGQYGLATVVPAIAGPYNLGTVVVRQALHIDPNDAHVTAVSDPFPTILDGVPLRLKTVNLTLNRPGFIINPTSCNASQITASIQSVGAASASVSSPFQVGSCLALPFNPHLGINLSGNGQTTDGKHPTLKATLTAPTSGQANLSSAKVTLPLSIALDPTNTNVLCSVAAAAAVNCPAKTIVGTASAVSPLLPDPLNGNVYLVQGVRKNSKGQLIKTLPSLLIPLQGDIELNLRAQTSVAGGRLVTTFPSVPDAAVSNFQLTINGGKHGILVVTHGENLCSSKQHGGVTLGAHSGKAKTSTITLGTPCAGKPKQTKGRR
jgi:hypothetical protein